jgi:glycerate kinase
MIDTSTLSQQMAHAKARAGPVVAAPDKFKGTLSAAEAAAHIAAGLRRARPGLAVRQVPVADGGDGTVAAAVAAGYRPVRLTVRGPTGRPVQAEFACRDGTAIIEAAQACGLVRLPGGTPEPLTATSFGVGELIAAAAGRGVRRIVLGLGGVASTDGGAGMVQALGGVLLDHAGRDLPAGGAALAGLDRLDLAGLMPLGGIEVLVASDVDNPLLGRHGAAAVYGPQKGASRADLATLETGLARWADYAERAFAGPAAEQAGLPGPGQARRTGRTGRTRDAPGAGAAGGLGFAALALLGARIRPGIELMLDMISFTERLAGARLVITGEGSLDAQTLRGKAPAGVARAVAAARAAACPDAGAPGPGVPPAAGGPAGAVAACLPVVAVAGTCTLTSAQLRRAGIEAAYTLADIEPDVGRCLTHAGPLLEEAARRLAADWLPAGARGRGTARP